jgi:hypothetical protein
MCQSVVLGAKDTVMKNTVKASCYLYSDSGRQTANKITIRAENYVGDKTVAM